MRTQHILQSCLAANARILVNCWLLCSAYVFECTRETIACIVRFRESICIEQKMYSKQQI